MILNTLALVGFLCLPAQTTGGEYERGIRALDNNDFDAAIVCFSVHLLEYPTDAVAYSARGLAYCEKKEYDKAIADQNEAIRLDPKLAGAYDKRGVAYFLSSRRTSSYWLKK